MKIWICKSKRELGRRAAKAGAELIRKAIRINGIANIVLPAGASQFEMISALAGELEIRWEKVIAFHLDEYVGMAINHPASFRLYLWKRFISKLPFPLKAFYQIEGEQDYQKECLRLSRIIRNHPIDVAFIGIGENGHIAFNDPPADFKTTQPYILVKLDEICRSQQLREGWFQSLEEVPKRAISMSIKQIMKSKSIICSVPDTRKAKAVKMCLEGPVTPIAPGSILQLHKNARIYLDFNSASLLEKR